MLSTTLVLGVLASYCETLHAAETESAWRQSFSMGGYYSKGDYGQGEDVTVHYVPLNYSAQRSNWKFGVSASYIRLSGAGEILLNGGVLGSNGSGPLAHSGKGDVLLSVTYQLPAYSENAFFFDISLDVKLPTADELRGLGTGQPDYGIKLDTYKLIGKATVFSTLEYKYREASSLFPGLTDSINVSLGASLPLNQKWSYGLIYDFREAAVSSFGDTHELVPYLSWSPSPNWAWMSYAVKGFTEDSADTAVGLQLSYSW
ncbi:MAG: hypothetical protein R3332_02270 [Pseudohongiellaceae bacterium]|nr:hypothetical protein [Pseudohongiellaceae bacterium]